MTAGALDHPASSPVKAWLIAARPATLSAAFVPVFVGTAVAHSLQSVAWLPALAALLGAFLLQIGSNLANDVFDYEKGADTEERLGPTRAVQAGLISPDAMKRGMIIVLLCALLVGIYLTYVAGPAIIAIGLCSMAAAVAYTAGPYPLGYHGLGDVFVMLFFGFVAVCGTAFVLLGHIPTLAWWASLPVGSIATSILAVNNVRDYETDAKAGKRTIPVRFGRSAGVFEYVVLLLAAYATPLALVATNTVSWPVLLPLVTLPLGIQHAWQLHTWHGRALNATLVGTARLLFLFGCLFGVGLLLG